MPTTTRKVIIFLYMGQFYIALIFESIQGESEVNYSKEVSVFFYQVRFRSCWLLLLFNFL